MKPLSLILVTTGLLLAACSQPVKTAEPVPASAPTATALPAGVELSYEQNAQIELVTPAGRRIYLDVGDPTRLLSQPGADDVLLTTHAHDDHNTPDFVKAFPGQQIFIRTGKIELPDITITSIASAHNAKDPLQEKDGTNYIFILETGGLRLVHFGDIGQETLSAGQLAAIGAVDVAVMQFDNSYSDLSYLNKKGFNLMDQVKPRLIIPTHTSLSANKMAAEKWSGFWSEAKTVKISRDLLPEKTSLLVLGDASAGYGKMFKLKLWE